MHVKLEGAIDDDARDMSVLLRRLNEIHREASDRKWQIRCGGCTYLGPWAATVLLAAFLRGVELRQQPRIKLPRAPDAPAALLAYCEFSGMSHRFESGRTPNPDHPDCETVPLTDFRRANWNLSDGVIRLLRRHMELSDESEDQVRTCIGEVAQNVEDHARSSIGGILSARYFERFGEVRVAIVDRGIGIGASVRSTRAQTTGSLEALRLVIEGGFSSKSRPNNMGLGVSNLFRLIASSRGKIAVYSGDAMAEAHQGGTPRAQTVDFDFPGTAVFFTLPLSRGQRHADDL